MNDLEHNLKAGINAATLQMKPKQGKIGIWSSRMGVAL